MIYLIRSSAIKDKDNNECNEFEIILKIGYTKESGNKGRFNAYITENPTCQILYLIPGGTKLDERNLHIYFKKYLKYGNEWFSNETEILEFFKTHKTIDSLRELNYLQKKKRKEIEDRYISRILLSIINSNNLSNYIEVKKNLYSDIDNILCNVTDIDSYFILNYPDINFNDSEINLDVRDKNYKFVELFREEFRQDENFVRRMRMYYRLVTEFSDIYNQNINVFNSIIPISYQSYMNLLGPEQIKAVGYREIDIKSRAEAILNTDQFKAEIILKFKPGNKYSLKNIKEVLKDINIGLGIDIKPKASDLEKYFKLKECTILNSETGKWDRGFEILELK